MVKSANPSIQKTMWRVYYQDKKPLSVSLAVVGMGISAYAYHNMLPAPAQTHITAWPASGQLEGLDPA
jgi:hypothetical protein